MNCKLSSRLKTVYISIFLCLFISPWHAGEAMGAASLDLELIKSNGRDLVVNVVVGDVYDLASCRYAISFDSSCLEAVSVTGGGLLDMCQSVPIDNANGLVGPIESTAPGSSGITGSGVISTIRFKAKKPFASEISFSLRELIQNGGFLIGHATNQIIAANVSPEDFYNTKEVEIKTIAGAEMTPLVAATADKDAPVQTGTLGGTVIDQGTVIIDDGVEVKFSISRQNDSLEMSAVMANSTGQDYIIEFPTSQRFDIAVQKEGSEVFVWSKDKLFLMAFEQQGYFDGELIFYYSWKLPMGLKEDIYDINLSVTATKPYVYTTEVRLP